MATNGIKGTLALIAGAAAAFATWAAVDESAPGAWRIRGWLGLRTEYAAHREARLAEFARVPEVPAGTVVFLGSSTIERFPLERCFPGVPTDDRGIGDEPVDSMVERVSASLPRGELGGVVVYAGSVDFRRDPSRYPWIAAKVGELLDRIALLRPGAPVCVVSPLPERGMSAETSHALAGLEEELRAVCGRRGVAFVRTDRPPLRDASGLSEAHSADRLHLSDAGYDVLAGWIVEDGGPAGRALAP
jgi:hypothetical protein